MAMTQQPYLDSEDLEEVMFSGTDNDMQEPSNRWRPSRFAAIVTGVACLAACGVAVAFMGASGQPVTGRQLLESRDLVDVMTKNTMKTAPLLKPEDEDFVRSTVAKGVRDLTKQIQHDNPEAFNRLNDISIPADHQRRILNVVKSMSDPRVQEIGYEVAKTIHEHKHMGRAAVKKQLMQKFQPRMAQIRSLKSEIYQTAGQRGDVPFNPDHMKLVNAIPDSWTAAPTTADVTSYVQRRRRGPVQRRRRGANLDHMELVNAIPDSRTADASATADVTSYVQRRRRGPVQRRRRGANLDHMDDSRRLADDSTTTADASATADASNDADASTTADAYGSELTEQDMAGSMEKFEEGLGIMAGIIDQARVCLDQVDFVGESFGKDMKIPYWAKSMVGGLDFVSELSDCMMRAGVNDVKKMMCPMKYASAFSDFMSGLDNMMGMSNSNMGMMGDSASGGGVADTGFDASNLATDVTDATGWGVATTIAPTTV